MRARAWAPDGGKDVPPGAGARHAAVPAAAAGLRTPAAVAALQRRAGNAATVATLRREGAAAVREVARTPGACGGSCACHDCAANHDEHTAEEELRPGALLARAVRERHSQLTLQRMAACPPSLGDSDPAPPGWKPYFGPSSVFHCGFRSILEDRAPTPDDPMNECVYDHSGTLVDEHHPYAGCRGTPDQYDSQSSPIRHFAIDSGGIVRAGAGAFLESRVHDVVEPVSRWLGGLESDIRRLYGAP
jgi:hypothetical protein